MDQRILAMIDDELNKPHKTEEEERSLKSE